MPVCSWLCGCPCHYPRARAAKQASTEEAGSGELLVEGLALRYALYDLDGRTKRAIALDRLGAAGHSRSLRQSLPPRDAARRMPHAKHRGAGPSCICRANPSRRRAKPFATRRARGCFGGTRGKRGDHKPPPRASAPRKGMPRHRLADGTRLKDGPWPSPQSVPLRLLKS
jgi:hypothetical protein